MITTYEKRVEASAIQEQFWFLQQIQPEGCAYNVPLLMSLKGQVDQKALAESIAVMVKRHEVLRTTFFIDQGKLFQRVSTEGRVELKLHGLMDCGEEPGGFNDKELIQKLIDLPFDLSLGPLMRCHLIEKSEDQSLLLFVFHHIIFDLHSATLFSKQLSEAYNNFAGRSQDGSIVHNGEVGQYSAFSLWQMNWMETKDYSAGLSFWQNSLAECDGYLNFPYDHLRTTAGKATGAGIPFDLGDELVKGLKVLAKELEVNLFLLLLASYYVLLFRYSRQNEIIVGVPLTNRRKADHREIIGCFVNILPIAVEVDPDKSFLHLVKKLRKKMLFAHRHQETPFSQIAGLAKGKRDAHYNPWFQVGFTFQPPMTLTLQGVTVQPEHVRSSDVQLDLFPILWQEDNNVVGFIEYNKALLNDETAFRFMEHWQVLLSSLVHGFSGPINRIPLLTGQEQDLLLKKWNDTYRPYPKVSCLHHVFAEQVKRDPEAIALVGPGFNMSYGELDRRTNQLGHFLQRRGVKTDALVGVCMDRSVEMVIALYGILKAGGAYVPLDPSFPADRLAFMMEDARMDIILTQQHICNLINSYGKEILCLDSDWQRVALEQEDAVNSGTTSSDLAYVIYTSGSTGRPKGAMNQHDGICNRLYWMQEEFGLKKGERVLQKTPYSFDVSVWEFFWPLQVGASLVIAPPESHYDPEALISLIEEHNVTTIHFVPSMLQIFLESENVDRCGNLKRLICSGEALPYDLQERVFFKMPHVRLYNLYGPTEAAVDVTCWYCQREDGRVNVPIGKPIANTQIYIVDDCLQLTPIGVPGELLIGGVQVARGYLRREELSRQNFIENTILNEPDSRLYRTGDLARLLADGTIEYLGRLDHQVQLHGLRIELGEIEATLAGHPGVQQTVVVLKELSAKQKVLVAYVTTSANDAEQDSRVESELKKYLEQQLPRYMVPTFILILNELPLTASGKVDRKCLPEPHRNPVTDQDSMRAQGASEQKISQIWQQVLGHESIRLTDSFFDVGGNSLLAVTAVSMIGRELGVDVPVVKFFQYPSVRAFAQYIDEEMGGKRKGIDIADRVQKQRAALVHRKRGRGLKRK